MTLHCKDVPCGDFQRAMGRLEYWYDEENRCYRSVKKPEQPVRSCPYCLEMLE
jgi:hypothetical protein